MWLGAVWKQQNYKSHLNVEAKYLLITNTGNSTLYKFCNWYCVIILYKLCLCSGCQHPCVVMLSVWSWLTKCCSHTSCLKVLTALQNHVSLRILIGCKVIWLALPKAWDTPNQCQRTSCKENQLCASMRKVVLEHHKISQSQPTVSKHVMKYLSHIGRWK